MKRSRMLILGAAAVLLLALLASCSGDDDPTNTPAAVGQATTETAAETEEPEATSTTPATTPAGDPTATPAQDAPTATARPEATETPDAAGDGPTATSGASGNSVVGTASVEDDTDDVGNLLMQEPDEPMPGIDLTSVRLEADGNQIVVTIQTAGDIEAELSDDVDVSFDVHLWQDDKPVYAMSFHHNGSDDWEASITDFSVLFGDEETIETDISISGNTLSAAFPLDMMPELETSFQWYSSVMLSGGGMLISPDSWFDGAPENVIALLADPDKFVEFPQ